MNELKRNQLEVGTFIPDIIKHFDMLKSEELNWSILKIIKPLMLIRGKKPREQP